MDAEREQVLVETEYGGELVCRPAAGIPGER